MTTATIAVQDRPGGPLDLLDVLLPAPRGHEVLVELAATGVCQSQLFWMGQERTQPMLFGHEGYGVVNAVGDAVNGLAVGDRVLVTWLPARSDRAPERSSLQLPDGRVALAPNVYTWGTHCVVDELYVVPLTAESCFDEVCIAGCALPTGAGAAVNIAGGVHDLNVAVIGVGGVGQSAVVGAVVSGARRVVAVDVSPTKLERARLLGAHAVVCTDDPQRDADGGSAALLRATMDGADPDIVIDCVGAPATVALALAAVRSGVLGSSRGGTVVVVGLPKEPHSIDIQSMLMRDLTLTATSAGGTRQEQIAEFLAWERADRFRFTDLVTDYFDLNSLDEAVAALVQGRVLGRAIVQLPGSQQIQEER